MSRDITVTYRFEFAKKFWEVTDHRTTLSVRFGRIGTEGQTKPLGTEFPARAALDRERGRLIRAKERAGYTWVATREDGRVVGPTSSRPPKKAAPEKPVRAAMKSGNVAPVLRAVEHFLENVEALGERGPLFVSRHPRKPSAASAIAQFEKTWHRKVPSDLAAFWASSVPNFTIEGARGELHAMVRFDGPGAARAATVRKIFASETRVHKGMIGELEPGQFERGRLFEVGIPFVDDENPLLWDSVRGGVRQTSGEPLPVPTEPIAETFTEFLRHYVAAGCFHCGTSSKKHFEKYWKLVEPHVPIRIPLRQNLWLRHLRRYYPSG